MEAIEGEIWCNIHGCIHDEKTDPYQYGFAETGEKPECGPGVWRRLWAGAYLTKFDPDEYEG